jgi:hypothetical protein
MSSMPMSAVPMPSVPVASIPMPATVGMPWHHADQEQQGDHDEYASPRLPSSHGLTSVLTLLFACDTPPDVYCTHDRPRVASTEAQETRDGRPKLGGDCDVRGSSIRMWTAHNDEEPGCCGER